MVNMSFTAYELRAISYAMNKVNKEGISGEGEAEFERAKRKVEYELDKIEGTFMKTGKTWNSYKRRF